ncbi:hypothetical protein mRhiFer1_010019 [Rhinolophus ferrumequinum]|uniref:Small ribosomal subunit protein eS6 n=1 Tax=Rhinolophus ferrumequinum TaxID=59479 RepID=A0A7J7Y5D7_RHIFE|nr:hypothetical protein mRhiFer1_010019 [Rhinolophus ferrumequinum]
MYIFFSFHLTFQMRSIAGFDVAMRLEKDEVKEFLGKSNAWCLRRKLNISFPATGCQKVIEVDDERKLHTFYEKHMATEVAADALGEEWKGYVVRISDEKDQQAFPMKQGDLTHGHVCLLLSKGHSCYRPRRTGERNGKSI